MRRRMEHLREWDGWGDAIAVGAVIAFLVLFALACLYANDRADRRRATAPCSEFISMSVTDMPARCLSELGARP